MNEKLLHFQMLLVQAEIRMNAMIAENKLRESKGESPAYGENEFMAIIEDFGIHHNNFPFGKG